MIIILDGPRGPLRTALAEKLAKDNFGYVRRADEITRKYRFDEDLDLLAEALEKASADPRTMILDGWLDAVKEEVPLTMNAKLHMNALTGLARRLGAVFHPHEGRLLIHEMDAVAALKRANASGIGHPWPEVLFVSEGPSRGMSNWRGLPFSNGSAANLLMTTLAETDKRCYFMNIRRDFGFGITTAIAKEELRIFSGMSSPPKLISLGEDAVDFLRNYWRGVFSTHEHPGHCLRFNRAQVGQWAKGLRKLVEEE